MNRKEQLEKLRNAMGMTAEMSLIFYRAALGAGASMEEAMKLVQAYIAAVLFGQNKKGPEGEGDPE